MPINVEDTKRIDPNLNLLYPEDRAEIPQEALAQQPSELPATDDPNQPASVPYDLAVQQEVANMVTMRKKAAEDYRREKINVWDKCWDHYKQVYDKTNKEGWQSTIFQPDTTKVVEIITSNLHSALMGPELPIEWQCKVKEFESDVQDVNDLIKYDVQKSKFKLEMTDYLRGMSIVGTAVGKVDYDLEYDTVMVKQRPQVSLKDRAMAMLTGQPIEEQPETYKAEQMKVKDWSKIKTVDLYKIFPEPHTDRIDRNHWIIEESTITNQELMALVNDPDEYYRLQNVTPDLLLQSYGKQVEMDPDTASRRAALMQNDATMFYLDPDTPHQLLEYWGPVPRWMLEPELQNDDAMKYELVNAWIWIIDEKWCVRKKLNPNRDGAPPYFKDCYIEIPGDWYGIGPAELMLGLQIEKNEVVNTGSDQMNLSLNKISAVLKDKVPKGCWDRLVSKPGALWLFSGVDDVKKAFTVLDFPPLTKDWYGRIQLLDAAIQEVTAAVKATVGVGGAEDEAGGGTFRGQLLNKQVASERFMMTARSVESNGLSDAFRRIYHRIYQYKTFESAIEILGPERGSKFTFLPPEKLESVASLVPVGVLSMETKGVKLAQMSNFAKLWGGDPWFKRWDLARRMWVEMGYSDPDTVTMSEDELKQYNEFRQQAMAMTGAGGPQGPTPGRGGPPGGPNRPPGGGPVAGEPIPPQPARPEPGPGANPIDSTGGPLG